MSGCVVFRPTGAASAVPFAEIGQVPAGAWGVVEVEPWLAAVADDAFQLLYLSTQEYGSAMRGLEGDEVALAVEQRRAKYTAELPARALGTVEQRVRRCIRLASSDEQGAGVRADLLTALASFTTVPRLAHTAVNDLVDYLREGDAEIAAELESPSVRGAGDFDGAGSERETRTQFASSLGQFLATRGQPEKALALPYFDVHRVYLISPASQAVEDRARVLRNPVRHWRGGTIVPWAERQIPEVEAQGHHSLVLFPSQAQFLHALAELTPAQFEAELAQRTLSPGYAAHLNVKRLRQASLRTAAHLLAGAEPELQQLLAEQTQQEASHLGIWFSPEETDAVPIDAAAEITSVVEVAALLAALCRRQQRESVAAKVEALGRALGHVAEEVRT